MESRTALNSMRDGARPSRRLLHASDLHLVSSTDKACQSLVSLVELAAESKVDLLVIAGDLFDYNGVDDNLVRFAVGQLRRVPVPVVILPGNHDCLIPQNVFDRNGLWRGCDNVYIFRNLQGEILDFPDLGISLWGKPVDSYERDVRPLVGLPPAQNDGRWHIVVAHGYCVSTEPAFFTSYKITRDEIISSDWDYIALGHRPIFMRVCDEPIKAYYSGSPSISDSAAIVDLRTGTGVQVRRCSVK